MRIIANHAHVFQKQVKESGTLDSLRGLMEECGIEKAVAFAPFPAQFANDGTNQNRWLAKEISGDDRFFGFGTVDFSKDNLKDQVEEIKQLGLCGIKMHHAYQKIKIDCANAFEVYGAAQELQLPMSFHTGVHLHRISDYNMLLFDEIAYHFKELKFSLEHIGGYSFFTEALAVMANNPKNVYAGLTSVFDRNESRFWYLSEEKIRDLLWMTGMERSFFGLDFPYNKSEKIKSAIACMFDLGLGEADTERLLGGNLLKFLGV